MVNNNGHVTSVVTVKDIPGNSSTYVPATGGGGGGGIGFVATNPGDYVVANGSPRSGYIGVGVKPTATQQ
jgi:hypothetical protein